MVKQIHHSTAKMIIRNHSYLTYEYSTEEIYKQIKNGTSHLLRTGAKMFSENGKVYLSGYAMDNSDIMELYKKDPLRKKRECWDETGHL